MASLSLLGCRGVAPLSGSSVVHPAIAATTHITCWHWCRWHYRPCLCCCYTPWGYVYINSTTTKPFHSYYNILLIHIPLLCKPVHQVIGLWVHLYLVILIYLVILCYSNSLAGDAQPPTITPGDGIMCYGKATRMQSDKVMYWVCIKQYSITKWCPPTSRTRSQGVYIVCMFQTIFKHPICSHLGWLENLIKKLIDIIPKGIYHQSCLFGHCLYFLP